MGAGPKLQFSHLGVYVHDLARMVDFYTRVVGFTETDRGQIGDRQLVFLSGDPDEHHQLVLAQGRPEEVPFNTVNQISFKVATLGELRELYARLVEEVPTPIRQVTHGIAWSVYFPDPEGNRHEWFVDTPWYVHQPLAEPIDLTRPVAELFSETEALCKTLPGYQTRAEWRDAIAEKMGVGG